MLIAWLSTYTAWKEYTFLTLRCPKIVKEPYLRQIAGGAKHYALECDGLGDTLYISNLRGERVYEAKTRAPYSVREMRVPGTPNFMAKDARKKLLFVILGDANGSKYDLISIDMNTFRIKSRVVLPDTYYGITYSPARAKVYVSSLMMAAQFNEINPDTFKVARSKKLPFMMGWIHTIAADDPKNVIYLSDLMFVGNLYVLDIDNFKIIKTVHLGSGLSDIAISEKYNRIYVAKLFEGKIVVLDRDTLEPLAELPADYSLRSLAADDKRGLLYAATTSSRMMSIFDMRTNKLLKRLPIGANVRSILITQDDRVFYASNCGTFELLVDKALKQ
jgi:DNA-binding beta-propeller fold protein YncE